MHFTIRVEWRGKDGTSATTEFVTSDHGPCESAGDVGLQGQLEKCRQLLGMVPLEPDSPPRWQNWIIATATMILMVLPYRNAPHVTATASFLYPR
jgi:hypothetical protein